MSDLSRYQQIHEWVKNCFDSSEIILSPLKGDASFRRYYRLALDNSRFIVMDAPPKKESINQFIKTTQYLSSLGLNVPKVFHQNASIGSLILSDFGDSDLSTSIQTLNIEKLYQKAIDSLAILSRAHDIRTFPSFNQSHIKSELSLFDEWFLKKHQHIDDVSHREVYDFLITEILKQPTVAIHRDFHSRNLMLCESGEIGIIDHQDMMQGPLSYDLVSLLRDCYQSFDEPFINHMIDYYLSQIDYPGDDFRYYFDLTGIQRHLKAIGIFCRLNYRDKHSSYLHYIPNTLNQVYEVSKRYLKLKPLSDLIRRLR